MASTTYRQLQAECEARERVRLLTSLLQARLPERAGLLLPRLEDCSAETATRISELVGACRSDDELFAALETLLPDA